MDRLACREKKKSTEKKLLNPLKARSYYSATVLEFLLFQ